MAGQEARMMSPTGNNRVRSARELGDGGFTLVELILVMSLLLIVLAVAAPSLAPFFKGRGLDSEARRFVTLGVFPILGSTTALCLAAAALLKLNQPVIHLVNWFAYPLQIPLILVFIRLGEKIVGAPPVPFSITDMLQRFKDSPAQFLRDFGLTGLHGICGWLVVAPLVVAILYFALRPVLRKMAKVRIG